MDEIDKIREEGKKRFEKKDYARAVIAFRKATDEGDGEAQYRLGLMYRDGQGVPQDFAAATEWSRKASDQGNVAALFDRGWGEFFVTVKPVDFAQAYKWLTVAASRANNPDAREHIIKRRGFVAAKMTPAQVEEGEGLAEEWKAINAQR